jgi:hypothetical protein
VTFTYSGIKVISGQPCILKCKSAGNIFAAGEIMSGNILPKDISAALVGHRQRLRTDCRQGGGELRKKIESNL